jgi:hypothetical protein
MSKATNNLPTATVEQFRKILYANIMGNVPTMVFSQPGLGKTETFHYVAGKLASRFTGGAYVLSTTENNPIDTGGLWYVKEGLTSRAPVASIPLDQPVAILIDEFGDAPVYEQSGWYRLLLSQTIGDSKLCAGSYVCAASNRPEDSAAAHEVSSAAKGRCNCLTLRADYQSVLKYARTNNWDSKLCGFLNAFGIEVIDKGFNADCPYYGSTPRDFARLNRLEANNLISADNELSMLQIVGNIGTSAGSRYHAFRALQIDSPDKVFSNPQTAPIYDDVSKQFAYSAAVVGAMQDSAQSFKAVSDYCLRLDRVGGFGLAIDARNAQPNFAKSASFVPLAKEYMELVAK